LTSAGYESVQTITLDHVWSAAQFKKSSDPLAGLMHQEEEDEAVLVAETVGVNYTMRVVTPPADFAKLLLKSQKANAFFEKLSVTNQKEYVGWINSAKREETRLRRVEAAVGKLEAGKKNPSEK
jgi:hypothetical protein